jgi:hypothetical protein
MVARTHKDWLEFLRKAAELPIGYSVDDLLYFKRIAERQYPALAPLVAACIHLAQTSDMAIAVEGPEPEPTPAKTEPAETASPVATAETLKPAAPASSGNGHYPRDLMALLKDERLFPKNVDLVQLATRLLPDMRQYRFDKMSRSSIIGKIVDHMDGLPAKRRSKIVSGLREAAEATPDQSQPASSFFTRWEDIIRNMNL